MTCPEVKGNGDLRLRAEDIGHCIVLGSIKLLSLANVFKLQGKISMLKGIYVFTTFIVTCNNVHPFILALLASLISDVLVDPAFSFRSFPLMGYLFLCAPGK